MYVQLRHVWQEAVLESVGIEREHPQTMLQRYAARKCTMRAWSRRPTLTSRCSPV